MRIFEKPPVEALWRGVKWGDRKLPPGLRSGLGLLLCVGGLLGFLPVLGFWMLPLGLLLIALDVPPLRRRLLSWISRRRREERAE